VRRSLAAGVLSGPLWLSLSCGSLLSPDARLDATALPGAVEPMDGGTRDAEAAGEDDAQDVSLPATDADLAAIGAPQLGSAGAFLDARGSSAVEAEAGRSDGALSERDAFAGELDGVVPGAATPDAGELASDAQGNDARDLPQDGAGAGDAASSEGCDDGNRIDHDGCSARQKREHPCWTRLRTETLIPRHDAVFLYRPDFADFVLAFGPKCQGQGECPDSACGRFDEMLPTWQLAPGLDWQQLEIGINTLVPSRERCSLGGVFEQEGVPRGSRFRIMVLGVDPLIPRLDTLVLDEQRNSWEPLALSTERAPPPLSAGRVSFDRARGVLMLLGGLRFNEVARFEHWELIDHPSLGLFWHDRAAELQQAPGPRSGFGLAYHERDATTYIFGGLSHTDPVQPQAQADLWAFDGERWRQLEASGEIPSARSGAVLIHDTRRASLLLFGGAPGGRAPYSNALFEYRAGSWTRIDAPPPGYGPRPVRNASFVYNPDASYALLSGGVDREEQRNDVNSHELWRLQWREPDACPAEEHWTSLSGS
jgi:cysteine-rich repeat protein